MSAVSRQLWCCPPCGRSAQTHRRTLIRSRLVTTWSGGRILTRPCFTDHRAHMRARLTFCCCLAAVRLTATAVVRAASDLRIARVERDIRPVDRAGNPTGSAKSPLERMAELKMPRIGVAVFDHSEIIWASAYGLRDVERGRPVCPDTIFQAASILKPISSVGMFRLG